MRVCACGPKGLPDGGRLAARNTVSLCGVSPPRGSKPVECLHLPGHLDVDGRDEQHMGERLRAGRESTKRGLPGRAMKQ